MEGTATGVEAAYDVGPPAARRMAVPDIRQMPDDRRPAVVEALAALREADLMPPAPDEHASVSRLRRNLDLAVLRALGYRAGEAAALAGRCYEDYARWRRTIRTMQRQMETYRIAMGRSGVTRTVDPLRRTAEHIWEELRPETPVLPISLVRPADRLDEATIDPHWHPGPQEPMIEPGLVSDPSGASIDLGSWDRVRYAGMLLDIAFRPPLWIPESAHRARQTVERFESARAVLLGEAYRRALLYTVIDADAVVAQVEQLWLRTCRRGGMKPEPAQE